MAIYQVPCPDGTDPQCYGVVEVELDAEDLDDFEVEEYIKDHGVAVDVCAACGSDYTRDAEGNILD